MKKSMLDYILRAPMERARLHIELIPREVPTSAARIGKSIISFFFFLFKTIFYFFFTAREGAFNILLFETWH
jgi:hypothetical protein